MPTADELISPASIRARKITGIGWQPFTLMATSFGCIRNPASYRSLIHDVHWRFACSRASPGSGEASFDEAGPRRSGAGVISGGVEQAQAVWALAGPRVCVREADPRLLGVHAAIRVPGAR
jgi:hypothetical protein